MDSAEAFFDTGSLVTNLALFLGIDPAKVRVVNVVPENSGKRRLGRRANSATSSVQFQIANPAANSINSTTVSSSETGYALDAISSCKYCN
jgi:hypothetical protein